MDRTVRRIETPTSPKNPVVTRAAENSRTNRIIGVICPLCPLAFLLSLYQSGRWLVGAVGIENKTERNLKDLEEMMGNTKALKRDNKERKEILIGPSMAPRFSTPRDPLRIRSHTSLKCECRLRSKFRGADGKPTIELWQFCNQRTLRHFQEHWVALGAIRNA